MKHSGDPWTASGMKISNKQHEAPVRDFLTRILRQPKAHAQFLNMLSMLEHMGSRKIMVSQMDRGHVLSQDTLQHLAEEARHAYFFKRHAERIHGESMDGWIDSNTMTRVPALMYFGRMDAGITKRLETLARLHQQNRHPEQNEVQRSDVEGSHEAAQTDPYGWVSLIIELRACWLYGIYNDVVEKADFHLPLKGLLAEEDHHLAEMFEMCGENHDLLKELSAYETSLFEKLWAALEAAFPKLEDNREAA